MGGKQELSGIGYGLGVDRTVLALEAEGIAAATDARCEVFGVPLGDAAKDALVEVAGRLRAAGVRVDIAYGGRGLKGAMKAADRSGARFALVLGENELASGEVELKDLSNGNQQRLGLDDVVQQLTSQLAAGR